MKMRSAAALGILTLTSLALVTTAQARFESVSPVHCVAANGASLAYNNAFVKNVSGGSAGVICPLVSLASTFPLTAGLSYTSTATLSCSLAGSFSPTGSITWLGAQSGSGTNQLLGWSNFGGESQTHYNIHCTVPNNGIIQGILESGNNF
jgi:hypothetical protein